MLSLSITATFPLHKSRPFQRDDVEKMTFGEFPKANGSAWEVLLRDTKQDNCNSASPSAQQPLLHFVLQKLGFAGWQKEGPPFTLQSKGTEGAQQPAGWAQGWLHPWLLEENLCLCELPASLLRLCVLWKVKHKGIKAANSSYLWRSGIYSKKKRPIASQSIVHSH